MLLLRNVFDPKYVCSEGDPFLMDLESDLLEECCKFGVVKRVMALGKEGSEPSSFFSTNRIVLDLTLCVSPSPPPAALISCHPPLLGYYCRGSTHWQRRDHVRVGRTRICLCGYHARSVVWYVSPACLIQHLSQLN